MISIPRDFLTWLLSLAQTALSEEETVLNADEIGDLRPHLTDAQRRLLLASYQEKDEHRTTIGGWLSDHPTIHEIALLDRDEVSCA